MMTKVLGRLEGTELFVEVLDLDSWPATTNSEIDDVKQTIWRAQLKPLLRVGQKNIQERVICGSITKEEFTRLSDERKPIDERTLRCVLRCYREIRLRVAQAFERMGRNLGNRKATIYPFSFTHALTRVREVANYVKFTSWWFELTISLATKNICNHKLDLLSTTCLNTICAA